MAQERTPRSGPFPVLAPGQMVALGFGCLIAIIAGIGFRSVLLGADAPAVHGAVLGSSIGDLVAEPRARGLSVYDGHGAWVDAFDYVPAYSNGDPALDVSALDDMVAAGVETVYLQAARDDERALGLIVDGPVVARWLVGAHQRGLDVVAWFLPGHRDTARDLAHVEALHDFRVLGHTFDGIALDIESIAVDDPVARSAQLVELTRAVDELVGDEPVGAIVLPPVLLEVVNPDFWPAFPWSDVGSVFDVWLPMAYWSERTVDSGYHDGFTYLDESVRRLRANLGDPGARVHGIGGIGDALSDTEIDRFGDALDAVDAIGGSVYDWVTLPAGQRALVAEAVGDRGS